MLEIELTVVFLAIMLSIPIWVSRSLANRKTEGPPGLFTGPRRYFYKWALIYLFVLFVMAPVGWVFEFYLSFGNFYHDTQFPLLNFLDNFLFWIPLTTAPLGLPLIFFLSKKLPHQ